MIAQRHDHVGEERRLSFTPIAPASSPLTDSKNSEGDGRRRFFAVSAATLCGVGVLVMLLGYWPETETNQQPGNRQNAPLGELRVLQPLVTGNLALFLSWIWLDLRAPRRNEEDGDARFGLWLLATAVAVISTFCGAGWTGMVKREPFVPFLLFLVGPVLVITIPLIWDAARRIERAWLRAVLLAGLAAASAIMQHGYDTGGDAELQVFTMNSCLIGLAVTVWLLTWAASPEPRRNT